MTDTASGTAPIASVAESLSGSSGTATPRRGTLERVGLDMRYSGAWNEINARLQLRQGLILYYAGVTFPAIGWLGYDENAKHYWYLAFFFPLISWIVAEMLAVHERMIGNLHYFCKYCELLGDPNGELPSYHSQGQPWSIEIPRSRRAHHLIVVGLMLVSNVIAFALAFSPALAWVKGGDVIMIAVVVACLVVYWGITLWTLGRVWALHKARLEIDRRPLAPGAQAANA
ncbi:MAG TPA: hypothetical protein VGY53_11705 [Isosphaeraceae bacterium]|jgi:hypothetical protein|nr:hypothetical protein [Isosphaeraceae bacterium]